MRSVCIDSAYKLRLSDESNVVFYGAMINATAAAVDKSAWVKIRGLDSLRDKFVRVLPNAR